MVLEENVLRQRVTTDIATKGGQYDVMTIGTYEVPIWAKQGWIKKFDNLPATYDVNDVLKPVREGLSYNNELYALPFYAESSMTYYRKDLVEKTGMTMPEQPTYQQIKDMAAKIHDPATSGLRHLPARQAGLGREHGVPQHDGEYFRRTWFDQNWNTKIDTPEWKEAVSFYIDLLKNYGPPGASSNGFNENLAMFSNGQCGMWIDSTVAAGMLYNPATSKVADKLGFAQAPIATWPKGSNWLWSWALAVPEIFKEGRCGQEIR